VRSVSVAATVIFDARGCVLLVRTAYGERAYGPPGGRIEAHETPQAAARREASEETGLSAEIMRLIGIYSFIGDGEAVLAFAFLGTIANGRLRAGHPEEISDVGWFETDSLPQPLDLVGTEAIPDALARNFGVVRERLPWKPR
jgi:8-oxo-dGTP diphosphatase